MSRVSTVRDFETSEATDRERPIAGSREAILDQVLFAGTNFLVGIFLARLLNLKAYGAFSVALSVVYIAGAFHSAVLTEPLMVFGSTSYRSSFGPYMRLAFKFHWTLSGGILVLLAVGSAMAEAFGSPAMAGALAGASTSAPLILLIWLVRPICYLRGRSRVAVLGSIMNAGTLAALLFVLWHKRVLSPYSSFLAIGGAAAVGSSAIILILWRSWSTTDCNRLDARLVLREHWKYGSWNVLATIARFSSGQILVLSVPIFFGLQEAGVISFILTLMRPLFLLVRVIAPAMLPFASSLAIDHASSRALRGYILRWLLLCGGGSFLYGTLVVLFYVRICQQFFGNRYNHYQILVVFFALAYTASVGTQVLSVPIRAAGATKAMAAIWAVPGIVSVVLCVPVLIVHSLTGVVVVFSFNYWFIAVLTARQSAEYLGLPENSLHSRRSYEATSA